MLRILTAILIMVSFNAYSMPEERKKNEEVVLEAMGVPEIAQKAIQTYKYGLIKKYPSINDEILVRDYNDLFVEVEAMFISSYRKGLMVYSDKELDSLAKLFKTDFGQWYSKKSVNFNEAVQNDFENIYEHVNSGLYERYKELNNK